MTDSVINSFFSQYQVSCLDPKSSDGQVEKNGLTCLFLSVGQCEDCSEEHDLQHSCRRHTEAKSGCRFFKTWSLPPQTKSVVSSDAERAFKERQTSLVMKTGNPTDVCYYNITCDGSGEISSPGQESWQNPFLRESQTILLTIAWMVVVLRSDCMAGEDSLMFPASVRKMHMLTWQDCFSSRSRMSALDARTHRLGVGWAENVIHRSQLEQVVRSQLPKLSMESGLARWQWPAPRGSKLNGAYVLSTAWQQSSRACFQTRTDHWSVYRDANGLPCSRSLRVSSARSARQRTA